MFLPERLRRESPNGARVFETRGSGSGHFAPSGLALLKDRARSVVPRSGHCLGQAAGSTCTRSEQPRYDSKPPASKSRISVGEIAHNSQLQRELVELPDLFS